MWGQPVRAFKYNTEAAFCAYNDSKAPEDMHTHSPTRHGGRTSAGPSSQAAHQQIAYNDAYMYRTYPPALPQWTMAPPEQRFIPFETVPPDPFVDPRMIEQRPRRNTRSTLSDVSMLDYMSSRSASSRAISCMTGVSYEHSKQPSIVAPMDDEQYRRLIDLTDPSKAAVTMDHPLPISNISSVPAITTRPSAAAKARSATYSSVASRSSILKEISQPASREVSVSSTRSSLVSEAVGETLPAGKVRVSPRGYVRGKKERLSEDNKDGGVAVEPPRRAVRSREGSQAKVKVRYNDETML